VPAAVFCKFTRRTVTLPQAADVDDAGFEIDIGPQKSELFGGSRARKKCEGDVRSEHAIELRSFQKLRNRIWLENFWARLGAAKIARHRAHPDAELLFCQSQDRLQPRSRSW
jgi:hypothetical protein